MCHSLGPLARGLLFIQLAFYRNTPTPRPVLWDQAQFRRDTKVQLKTPFSHLEHPMRRGQGKGMPVGAKQVFSPKRTEQDVQKASSRARRNPPPGTRGKLRHTGKSRAVGREPGVAPPRAEARSAAGRASAGPWVRAPYLGQPAARGRSLGRISGRRAPGERRPMSLGRGPSARQAARVRSRASGSRR